MLEQLNSTYIPPRFGVSALPVPSTVLVKTPRFRFAVDRSNFAVAGQPQCTTSLAASACNLQRVLAICQQTQQLPDHSRSGRQYPRQRRSRVSASVDVPRGLLHERAVDGKLSSLSVLVPIPHVRKYKEPCTS